MENKVIIGGELHSVASEHKVVDASEVKDGALNDKSQAEINSETLREGEEYGEAIIPELTADEILTKRVQTLTFSQKENVIGNILDVNYSAVRYGMNKKYLKMNLSYPGLPFDGIIDENILVTQRSYSGSNYKIMWSSFYNGFVAQVTTGMLKEFYADWPTYRDYAPQDGMKYVANDTPYVYDSTTDEKLVVDANASRLNQLT